jgi:asparagine synthase (glutamine-hydrolysing)
MNPVGLRDFLSVFPINERNKLLSNEFLTLADYPQADKAYTNIFNTATAKDELNLALECDQRELLPNQVLPFVDRLSMAFGVEVRCPFLDYRIIEFANKLPGSFKIHDGTNKYIYRLAINSILPKELFDRPKEGFVQPNYSWMHGPLKNWTLSKLNELPKQWFRQDYLDKLITDFLNNNQYINSKIWNLVCFSIWWNNYGFN